MNSTSNYCGLLPIYKPQGLTSKDISRKLWRLGLKAKMGHVGTLDPGADGVLPLLLGKATVVQDLLLHGTKAYSFTVMMGFETDTLDADGLVRRHLPCAEVTREQLLAAVSSCVGPQEQVPPAYSAVKFQGQALYKSARKGREQEIDREALRRPIEVYSLTLDDFSRGLAAFTVHCSKGTYVRVLAQTLMEKVGTCGTVVKLTRTACAGLTLAECVSLAQIEAALANGSLSEQQFIIPIPKLALGLAQLQAANSSSETRLLAGQELIYSQQNFIGNKFESWDNSKLSAGGMSNDVLLLDCAGTALGLGKITYLAADRITVRMKRSLL